MTFAHLIVFYLQVTSLLSITSLVIAVTKRLPALRLAVIRVSLLAVVGLVIASPWSSEREHPAVPVSISLPRPVSQTKHVEPQAVASQSALVPVTTEAAGPTVDLEQIFLVAWGVGSGLLAINLLIGYVSLFRIRRTCRRVESPLFQVVASAFGLRTPRLVEGDAVGNPFVAGILHPTVFLPTGWLDKQDAESNRAVLQHEVAHVAGGDLRWGLFHRLLTIALWPQPLLWALKRPMAGAEEELCDRHVLAAGVPDHIYADCLLRLREGLRSRPCPSLGIGAVSSRSSIGKRIEAILDRRRSRSVRLSPLTRWGTRLGGLVVAILIGVGIARPIIGQHIPTDVESNDTRLASYRIRLRNGVTVQASTVNWNPVYSTSSPWLPDGTPIGQAKGKRLSLLPPSTGPVGEPSRPRLEVKFSTPDSNGIYVESRWPGKAAVWGDKSASIELDPRVGQSVVDVPIGIGAGPLRLITRSKLGEAPLHVRLDPSDHRMWTDGLSVQCDWLPGYVNHDVKLLAIDHHGRELPRSGMGLSPGERYFAFFEGVTLADVDHFELRERDIEWGTIRNVHVRPSPKKGPVTAAEAEGPYVLHDGSFVRLAFVRDASDSPAKLWTADGSPAYDTSVKGSLVDARTQTEAGMRSLIFNVQVSLVSHMTCNFATAPPFTNAGSASLPKDHDQRGFVATQFKHSQKTCDVTVGIATGPYDLRTRATGWGKGTLHPEVAAFLESGEAHSRLFGVRVRIPSSCEGEDLTLIAVCRNGARVSPVGWVEHSDQDRATHSPSRVYGYSGIAQKDVDYFELQGREYEWITFRGVHLYPRSRA